MEVVKRLCVKNLSHPDDKKEDDLGPILIRGKEYTTMKKRNAEKQIHVMTRYWFWCDSEYFHQDDWEQDTKEAG